MVYGQSWYEGKQVVRAEFRYRINRSATPLDAGWRKAMKLCLTPHLENNSCRIRELKVKSLSQ